jgi:hypothetical protein
MNYQSNRTVDNADRTEDRLKQILSFTQMLEHTQVQLEERPEVTRGACIFFDRGWPNNHFTVDMAARAGKGLVPPVYAGIGSEGSYFQMMKTPTVPIEPVWQFTAPDNIHSM